jgi:hypothetical protein
MVWRFVEPTSIKVSLMLPNHWPASFSWFEERREWARRAEACKRKLYRAGYQVSEMYLPRMDAKAFNYLRRLFAGCFASRKITLRQWQSVCSYSCQSVYATVNLASVQSMAITLFAKSETILPLGYVSLRSETWIIASSASEVMISVIAI